MRATDADQAILRRLNRINFAERRARKEQLIAGLWSGAFLAGSGFFLGMVVARIVFEAGVH